MDVVLLVGRIMFALLFVLSGLMHLRLHGMLSQYAAAKRVPAAPVLVALTGLQIIAGGLLVALGLWADLGALLLAVFLVPTAVMMHNFWAIEDPNERATEQTQFLKDLALAGAALVLFAVFAQGGPLGPALSDPLFDL